MNLRNIIQRATEFGTFRSSKNFFSFALKCIFYIIPAIILGNYTDITIQKIQKNKLLGNYILYYILLQTLIIIATLYVILFLWSSYTHEFQLTISGAFFGVLYFGIQPNYTDMIRTYMND
jgi:hypothetical protein